MPSLLVRGVDEETRRSLAIRAAQNGRSLQAEALEILRTALLPERESWISAFTASSQSVGGFNVAQPKRHRAREFEFDDA